MPLQTVILLANSHTISYRYFSWDIHHRFTASNWGQFGVTFHLKLTVVLLLSQKECFSLHTERYVFFSLLICYHLLLYLIFHQFFDQFIILFQHQHLCCLFFPCFFVHLSRIKQEQFFYNFCTLFKKCY